MRRFLFLMFTNLFFVLLFAPVPVEASNSIPLTEWQNYLNWCAQNWVFLALIISEIAAFLPPQFNGILQGAISILSYLLKKNKVKS